MKQTHRALTVTSLLTLTTPVIATVGAFVVLDEPLLLVQAIGMAVVLVGLAVVVRRRSRSTRAAPEPVVVPVDDPALLA